MSFINFSCERLQSTFLWTNILTTWWCWRSWPTAPSSRWPSPSTRRSEYTLEQSICREVMRRHWQTQSIVSLSLSLCWLSLKAQTSHEADLASLSSREFVISDNIFWVAFKFPTIGRDYLICKSERNLSSNFRFNYAISSSLSSIWDKARC